MFHKFPSTPYIETNIPIKRSDKILQENELKDIFHYPISIEEKIDGANLGISFDDNGNLQLQNRGTYLYRPLEGQWKPLEAWIRLHEDRIFDEIVNRYILFGEWCYAKHSIYYNMLPDWFIGFDIYDIERQKFLSVPLRDTLLHKMGVKIVPRLGYGIYCVQELDQFLGKSKYGNEDCEGIYIRQDQGDYLKYRAKIVRKEFRQSILGHWSKEILKCNKVVGNK